MKKPLFTAHSKRPLLWLLVGFILSFNTLSVWHSTAHVWQANAIHDSSSSKPATQHLDDYCLLCQSAHQFNATPLTATFQLTVDSATAWQVTPASHYPLP